ncbi:Na+/H+ antiporter [Aliterella atlantica]|uniref:Sodium:hydrogen antiporter n=1 Tax=Aliterella atlantica CENA595 TaxID=1618023 RepID=A0A0D8ZWR8_9CYAN|nr:Na+/H+ antiporter [Aliterella atlantica]KJH72894.1 sodium:hydrogen antiporter [Aliterella atlantica CENA595]
MQGIFIQYIYIILIVLGLVAIANKLQLAYPIVLVLGGLALSFIAPFSNITINRELVFLVFLPPLLYEAAWQVSWKEFWKWKGIIISFAFPIVILTSCAIAFVSSALIPGFTLALGFLLGGIISPPDAVSATTIMQQVNVPKSLVSIIEGESLLNDASSLIVFRFALAAVLTGQFHLQEAEVNFILVILMGISIGLFVGLIFYGIHRLLPTTSSIEIVLTLITPYCMYYFAEHFHYSGVLAVVSGGLFLSSKRNSMLSYQSRIEGLNVWNNLVFVFNGLIFLLIGLELPFVIRQLGDISLGSAIWYGLIISLVLIVTRLLCTLGTSVLMRFMSRFIAVSDPNPGWRGPLIFGWAGMRGVVSLASALSVPILTQEGQPFPYRNLILFITFIVILVTLVFQGLTLPLLIRKVKLKDRFTIIPEQKQEIIIQKKLALASLRFLEEKYSQERSRNEYLDNLFSKLEIELRFFNRQLEESDFAWQNSLKGYRSIYLEMLERRRDLLNKMNRRAEFDEELIRKYLSLIDVEEFRTRNNGLQELDTD